MLTCAFAHGQSTFKKGIITPTLILGGDTVRIENIDGYVTDGNFEKLFDKYTEKTAEGINSLLKSVKENFTDEAEFVWQTYIKRYKIDFIISLGTVALSFILVIIAFLLWTLAGKKDEYDPEETTAGVFSIGLWILGGVAFITGVIAAAANFSKFMVPEFYVLQDLLGILK